MKRWNDDMNRWVAAFVRIFVAIMVITLIGTLWIAVGGPIVQ